MILKDLKEAVDAADGYKAALKEAEEAERQKDWESAGELHSKAASLEAHMRAKFEAAQRDTRIHFNIGPPRSTPSFLMPDTIRNGPLSGKKIEPWAPRLLVENEHIIARDGRYFYASAKAYGERSAGVTLATGHIFIPLEYAKDIVYGRDRELGEFALTLYHEGIHYKDVLTKGRFEFRADTETRAYDASLKVIDELITNPSLAETLRKHYTKQRDKYETLRKTDTTKTYPTPEEELTLMGRWAQQEQAYKDLIERREYVKSRIQERKERREAEEARHRRMEEEARLRGLSYDRETDLLLGPVDRLAKSAPPALIPWARQDGLAKAAPPPPKLAEAKPGAPAGPLAQTDPSRARAERIAALRRLAAQSCREPGSVTQDQWTREARWFPRGDGYSAEDLEGLYGCERELAEELLKFNFEWGPGQWLRLDWLQRRAEELRLKYSPPPVRQPPRRGSSDEPTEKPERDCWNGPGRVGGNWKEIGC